MRAVLRQGRTLIPPHAKFRPDFDLHERRLDEIERLFREDAVGNTARIGELHEEFLLDMQADMAASMSETHERIIRFTDEVAQKVEDKKFELPAETRDQLDDFLQPYQDEHRERMLGELPIETRRKLEEEQRRRQAGE